MTKYDCVCEVLVVDKLILCLVYFCLLCYEKSVNKMNATLGNRHITILLSKYLFSKQNNVQCVKG